VTSLSPATGPVGGGTPITIKGTGFSGVTDVQFGTGHSVPFTVNPDGTLAVTSPAHAAGYSNVFVTTPGGTSATVTKDRFTFG
jgi:hypothetical protein